MLATSSLIAFIATEDRARSKPFYQDTLGLPLLSEDHFASVFRAGDNMLRLVPVKQRVLAPYTVLGWEVADIAETVLRLKSAGVTFELFPGLDQDSTGIWSAPGGTKVAWFKDPDGNILSISQHAP